jgi:protein TonB
MALPDSPYPPVRQLNRNIVIGGSVVLFHVAALWALQSGLLRRAVEIVVPVSVLADIVSPPVPKAEPAPQPVVPKPPEPAKQPVARKIERASPAPQPVAVPSPAPSPQAPTGVEAQAPAAPAVAAPTAAAPSPAPAKLELPSSDAEYLRNPLPAYPSMSKRLGEQGKVLVRVLIGVDGTPQKAELKPSSGFDRLDRAALEHVMKCRYVPGKVGGVAQAMWYEAPVNFVLE